MRSLGHSSGRLRGARSPGHATTAGVLSERAGAGPWTAARAPSSGRMLASAGPCVGGAFAVRRKRRPLGACSTRYSADFPGCLRYGAGIAPRRPARQGRAPHGGRAAPARGMPPAMREAPSPPAGAESALPCMPCGMDVCDIPRRPARMRRRRAGRTARRQTPRPPPPAPFPYTACARTARAARICPPPPVQDAAGRILAGLGAALSRRIGRARLWAAGSSLALDGDPP